MELLLPFILLIGVMLLMTRSAKNKQRQAMEMRNSMEPGTGVRTIGGLYAMVVEVREDAVLLESEDGSQLLFAKNAIGAVLEPEEYERILSGDDGYDAEDAPVVPDDASSLTGTDDERDAEERRIGLDKDGDAEGTTKPEATTEPEGTDSPDAPSTGTEDTESKGSSRDGENGSKP
ncbi:preprotein translocase subunit YajC [Streptomyces spiramenti]|uniref:preprotein translocase subunit YajC n=1 Tax=Streptomyces spiramenti TaxID=2720606 RepID=UPI003B82E060